MDNKSEQDDAAVLKKLGFMDGEAVQESSTATSTHDGHKVETKTSTTRTTTAAPTANEHHKEPQENAHERVIRKFRQQGVLLTCANLAIVGVAALAIGRSNLSNFWLVLVIAFVGFVAHQQSKNITHGYISEAQKAMRDEVGAYIFLYCRSSTMHNHRPYSRDTIACVHPLRSGTIYESNSIDSPSSFSSPFVISRKMQTAQIPTF
jgi:hypothetical protein